MTSVSLPGRPTWRLWHMRRRLPRSVALPAAAALFLLSAAPAYADPSYPTSPFGLSVGGNAPQTPGSVVQTALPDNPQPISGGLNAPPNPLLNVGLLNGSAHARWSETLGPCVDTIADASTSVASLSLLNVIPSLPNLGLTGLKL